MGARDVGMRASAGAAAAIAAVVVLLGAGAAQAVPPGTVGSFPAWTISGSSTAFTGSAGFASPTLTSPTLTSDSASITTASGASAYLGAGTGFGADFGTSRAQPYLTIRPKSAAPMTSLSSGSPAPSTTTIDFGAAGAQPGWGFALGDIDADWVFVQGFDAAGAAVPVGDLGEQGTGNYCDTTPKPSSCSGVNAPFDVPNWTGTTASTSQTYATGTITYSAATVYGNFADTAGAYAWFTPAASVHKITLLYGALTGSPVFQLWIAQPAPQTVISGTVAPASGGAVPVGTSVQLDAADGTPVAGLDGDPATSPVAADGSYSITTEQRSAYQLQVLPPAGYATPAAVTVAATSATVSAPAIGLDPSPSAAASAPELAASGVDPAPATALGALLVAGGVALLTRRRARRSR